MVSTRAVRTLDDLLLKTKKTRVDCCEWQGAKKDRGYGILQYQGRKVLAHRLAAHFALNFDLKSESFICHHCDNPACVNPKHLYIGNALVNGRDRAERGVNLNYYRVTFEQIKIVYDLALLGVPLEDLEKLLRISKKAINGLYLYGAELRKEN